MFLWCHVRHINLVKEHAERIKNIDKKSVKEKDFKKTEI